MPDEPINAKAFEINVDKVAVRESKRGDILVMDDLSSRKLPKVKALVEAAGC